MGKANLKKYENEIVAHIYETYEYDRFKFYEENRGKKLSDGVDRNRASKLQRMVNSGQYYTEYGEVTVNLDFRVINGRHTFEVRRRNKMPIRWKFIEHDDFQGEKKDLFNGVWRVNKHSSSWSNANLYQTALSHKMSVAVRLQEIIKLHNFKFGWVELMGILKQNPGIFQSAIIRHTLGPEIFEDKKIVEYLKTKEFNSELNIFVRANDKARVGKKLFILASFYKILYRSNAVYPTKLVEALEAMTDDQIRAVGDLRKFIEVIIKTYNRIHGLDINKDAVISAIKNYGKGTTVKLG